MLKTIAIGKKAGETAQVTKTVVMSGDRIVLVDATTGKPPKKVITKIVNKDLYIYEEGAAEPSAILSDYESFRNTVQISGTGEGGSYVNYGMQEGGVMELGAASVPTPVVSDPLLSSNAMWGLGILAGAGAIAAAAGGGGGGGGSSTPADTTAPTAAITLDDTALTAGETATVTITFAEAVKNFTLADLSADNGTLSNLTTTDNIIWKATLTPSTNLNDTTNVITLADTYTDNAGNPGTAASSGNYTIDTTLPSAPTATITLSDTLLNAGETATVTITFSEAVTGFNNNDVAAQNGTLSTFTTSDNITWIATFTPTADINDTSNVITLISGSYTDVDSNPGAAAASENYIVDTTVEADPAPTVTITDDEPAVTANLDGSNTDGLPDANGGDILYTFTFSEAVKDFTINDITVTMQRTDGTVDSTYTAATDPDGHVIRTFTKVSDSVYTLSVHPEMGYEGMMKVSIEPTAATDSVGNTIDTTDLSTLSSLQAVDMLAPVPNDLTFDGVNDWQFDYVNKTITFTMDSQLEAVNMSTPDNFIVEVNTKPMAVDSIAMIGNQVQLIMTDTFTSVESVRVTYRDATGDISAAIQDRAGNDATSFTYLKPDVTPPTLLDVLFDNPSLSIGETTKVTLTFSEELSDLIVSFQNGTLTGLAANADDASIWTATFTPSANIQDYANSITAVSFHDLNLLANATTGSGTYSIDTLAPSVWISNDEVGVANIAGGNILYTFTFSEPVTGFTAGDVAVTNGTKGIFTTISDSVYTLEIIPTAGFEGNVTVSVAADKAFDVLGNPNSAAEPLIQAVDTKALAKPSFSLKTDSGVDANDGITNINGIDVTVDTNAIYWEYSLDGGVAWREGNGTSFNLVPDTLYSAGDIQLRQVDSAGNVSLVTQNTDAIVIDKTAPMFDSMAVDGTTGTITITMDSVLDPNAVASTNFTVYINGSAATVTGASISGSNVILSTGSAFAANAAVRVTYADTIGDENAPALADLAGNSAVGFTRTISDPATPTATIALSDTALKAGETANVTITFSEAVLNFSNADVTAANGTLSTFTTTDNVVWTATFTPTADLEDATNVITLADTYTDTTATAGTSAVSANYTIDTLAPTITITDDEAATGNIAGGDITYTFTFNEAVTGFTIDDVTVSGGAKGVFSTVSSTVYTLVVTPTSGFEGDMTVSVGASAASDAAGNGNITAQSTQAVDMKVPTLVITDDQSGIGNIAGGSITYTFTFSETVVGFTADDILVTNGAKGTFSGSGAVYTLVVTPTVGLEGDITVSVPAANQVDVGGNTGTLVTSTQTVDMLAPSAPTLALATDGGISATDGITNDPTINVSGIEPGASWEYSLNGGTSWIAGSGTSFELSDNTTYAIASVQVRQTDAAGNTSPAASNTQAITIDTLPIHLTITDDEPMVTANLDGSNTDGSIDANGADILYTFTFDQAVLDFEVGDISILNGTAKTFTKVSDTVYTLGVTPNIGWEGNMVVSVDPTQVHDIAGNGGENFTASTQAVDMLRPTVVDAIANSGSDIITLNFSETLDAINFANAANFVIEINGTTYSANSGTPNTELIAGISSTGNSVNIVLDTATRDLNFGDVVRIAYTDVSGDDTPAIQDVAGNDAASFGYITAAMTSSDTPPVLSNMVAHSATDTVVLTFNEALNEAVGNLPNVADFVVTVNEVAFAVTNVAISGTDVTLTINNNFATSDLLSVTYTDAVSTLNAIQDLNGNDAFSFSYTNTAVL